MTPEEAQKNLAEFICEQLESLVFSNGWSPNYALGILKIHKQSGHHKMLRINKRFQELERKFHEINEGRKGLRLRTNGVSYE